MESVPNSRLSGRFPGPKSGLASPGPGLVDRQNRYKSGFCAFTQGWFQSAIPVIRPGGGNLRAPVGQPFAKSLTGT